MHFYQQTESGVIPRHYVEMSTKPGQLRPTRMSDVRKAAKDGSVWVPSVTTILNVLDKPALVNWKVEQHLRVFHRQNWTAFESMDDEDEFVAEVKRLTELQMDIAPSAGTDVHKVLQQYVTDETDNLSDADWDICRKVFGEIETFAALGAPWDSESSFVSSGYGGQVDLVSKNIAGQLWVIDFKSKQSADKFKPGKMAYDDHRMQLAAYRMGLNMPTARCSNVFICLENGEVDFHEHTEDELNKGWELFKHCLAIWKIQNGA